MSTEPLRLSPLTFVFGALMCLTGTAIFVHIAMRTPWDLLIFLAATAAPPILCGGWLAWKPWRASCPECASPVKWISWRGIQSRECRVCERYLHTDGWTLKVRTGDHLSDTPVYRTGCPDVPRWPLGCCVCGATATRMLDVSLLEEDVHDGPINMALIATTGAGLKNIRYTTISVPHCDKHRGGASLQRGTNKAGGTLEILFRSRSFCARFTELNRDHVL